MSEFGIPAMETDAGQYQKRNWEGPIRVFRYQTRPHTGRLLIVRFLQHNAGKKYRRVK